MNVHDSEEIKSLIENLGYTETDNYEESDIYNYLNEKYNCDEGFINKKTIYKVKKDEK